MTEKTFLCSGGFLHFIKNDTIKIICSKCEKQILFLSFSKLEKIDQNLIVVIEKKHICNK